MDKIYQIESLLLDMLQSNIAMRIDGKSYRTGKLKNFKIFDLFIQFLITVGGKDKRLEIPIPFMVDFDDGVLKFSYTMSDMGDFGRDLDIKIKKSIGTPKNKLYNRVLTIERANNEC